MKKFKYQIITVLAIFALISVIFTVQATTENENITKESKFFVKSEQGIKINTEALKNSINVFQSLPNEKKAAIKNRLTELSLKRQKDIQKVEKKINEYKAQKNQNSIKIHETQISQLQAIQKIALKENATETAKSLEILISWYENKQNSTL